jgi:hypothetical protein
MPPTSLLFIIAALPCHREAPGIPGVTNRARRVVPTPLGRSLLETVAAAVDAPETASLIERIKRHSDVLAQPIKRS